MEDDMPMVAAIKARTATRAETEALLRHIAQDMTQGAARTNAACIALSHLMLMQEVGIDRTPLYPHFEALMTARDALVQAVVQFHSALEELELVG